MAGCGGDPLKHKIRRPQLELGPRETRQAKGEKMKMSAASSPAIAALVFGLTFAISGHANPSATVPTAHSAITPPRHSQSGGSRMIAPGWLLKPQVTDVSPRPARVISGTSQVFTVIGTSLEGVTRVHLAWGCAYSCASAFDAPIVEQSPTKLRFEFPSKYTPIVSATSTYNYEVELFYRGSNIPENFGINLEVTPPVMPAVQRAPTIP